MNKKRVELEILSISNSQAQAGAYALVLGEIYGERQIPIIIGAYEAQALLLSMKGVHPPRPLTHQLFASLIEAMGGRLLRVLIYKVDNGVFYSYLYVKTEEKLLRIDARTSDAIILSIRMGAPLFIYEDILAAECLRKEHLKPSSASDENLSQADKSFCEEELEALQSALQRAIEEENYEQAAQLRDQINQQNQQP